MYTKLFYVDFLVISFPGAIFLVLIVSLLSNPISKYQIFEKKIELFKMRWHEAISNDIILFSISIFA